MGADRIALSTVYVVPRNGYANRLQAWASAGALADRFGAELRVLWEPQEAAAADASSLFARDILERSFVESATVTAELGCGHGDLSRYLVRIDDQRALFLAGHDRGEQSFMAALVHELGTDPVPRTLVIVAGGHFSLEAPAAGARSRARFYRSLRWSIEIDRIISGVSAHLSEPFVGIHIRETDRSITAPPRESLLDASIAIARGAGTTNVLVASDTPSARERAHEELRRRGLRPWSVPVPSLDRSDPASGPWALAEWQLLGRSQAIAYSRASSYGAEAALLTPLPSAALEAGIGRRIARRLGSVAGAGVTRLRALR